MLAKMTVKNQITLPKRALGAFQGTQYFDVRAESGCIVLTPVRLQRADAVRTKLAELGITERDAAAALKWARA